MDLEKEVERLKFENEQYRERIKELNNLLETKEKNDRDIAINNKKFDTIQKIIITLLVTVGICFYWWGYFNCNYMVQTYIDNAKANKVNNNLIEAKKIEDVDITNKVIEGGK